MVLQNNLTVLQSNVASVAGRAVDSTKNLLLPEMINRINVLSKGPVLFFQIVKDPNIFLHDNLCITLLLAGVRAIGIAAAVGGSLAVMYNFGEKLWVRKGSSVISSPGWAKW